MIIRGFILSLLRLATYWSTSFKLTIQLKSTLYKGQVRCHLSLSPIADDRTIAHLKVERVESNGLNDLGSNELTDDYCLPLKVTGQACLAAL